MKLPTKVRFWSKNNDYKQEVLTFGKNSKNTYHAESNLRIDRFAAKNPDGDDPEEREVERRDWFEKIFRQYRAEIAASFGYK